MTIDVIVAGGPTGVVLASELRLAGVRTVVIEKSAGPAGRSRPWGQHVRSVAVTAPRGLPGRLLAVSERFRASGLFAAIGKPWPDPVDTADPHGLAIPQAVTERRLPRSRWFDRYGMQPG